MFFSKVCKDSFFGGNVLEDVVLVLLKADNQKGQHSRTALKA